MKRYGFVIWILAGMLLGSIQPAFAQETGRYQLFQAKYNHWDQNANASTEMNELFLLDTTSGEVQVYVSTSNNKGKNTKYWAPAVVDETATG